MKKPSAHTVSLVAQIGRDHRFEFHGDTYNEHAAASFTQWIEASDGHTTKLRELTARLTQSANDLERAIHNAGE